MRVQLDGALERDSPTGTRIYILTYSALATNMYTSYGGLLDLQPTTYGMVFLGLDYQIRCSLGSALPLTFRSIIVENAGDLGSTHSTGHSTVGDK